MLLRRIIAFVVFTAFLGSMLMAQEDRVFWHRTLDKENGELKEFYKQYGYNFAWMLSPVCRQELLSFLESAPELGLDRSDYQYELLSLLSSGKRSMPNQQDSVTA